MSFKCKVCEHIWETEAGSASRNKNSFGCPNCAGQAPLSKEIVASRVALVNPSVEVIGTYAGVASPIECLCKNCGTHWFARPNNLMNGSGCPTCNKKQRKSHETFLAEMAVKNPTITVIGTYTGSNEKVLCRCVNGHEWEGIASDLLGGHSCPYCYGHMKKSPEEFEKKLHERFPDIEILKPYTSSNTPMRVRCKIDGYEWSPTPYNLMNGSGCPKCSGYAHKTHEEFAEQMARVNPSIEIISKYVRNTKKVRCRCRIDGATWESVPKNLLAGWGCPTCSESRGERRIRHCLESLGINFIKGATFDDCRYIHKLPFDFFLPDLNTIIEYDGEQHYKPVKFGGKNDSDAENRYELTKMRDEIKNTYCKDNNIRLIRIPYTDYDNIENILNSQIA